MWLNDSGDELMWGTDRLMIGSTGPKELGSGLLLRSSTRRG